MTAAVEMRPTERRFDATPRADEDSNQADRPGVLIFGGGGDNAENFAGALKQIGQTHDIHIADQHDVDPNRIPHHELHRVDTEPGRARIQALIAAHAIKFAYVSTPPSSHVKIAVPLLNDIAEGKLDTLDKDGNVIDTGTLALTKPIASDREGMYMLDEMIEKANERIRARLGDLADIVSDPVWIHDHYLFKKVFGVVVEQLAESTNKLGRPVSIEIDIQEEDLVERPEAFGNGALDDLNIHGLAMRHRMIQAINESERYTVADGMTFTLERFQYENPDPEKAHLPENVETGFEVVCMTTVTDKVTGMIHTLPVTIRGGKGLRNRKTVDVNFMNDETGEKSTLSIDLQAKEVTSVPSAVEDLFPVREFDDNGYGASLAEVFQGGRPERGLQPYDEARLVADQHAGIRDSIGKHDRPTPYPLRVGGRLLQSILQGA